MTPVFNPQTLTYDDFTIKLKYYIKFLSSSATGVASTMQFSITTSDADGLKSWNAEEKTFQSGTAYVNEIDQTSANVFINYSTTLSNEGLNIGTSTSRSITLRIYNTICSASDYETTFFDNVEIEQKKAEPQTADQNFTSKLVNAGTKTSIKTRKSAPGVFPGSYRTRENYGVWNGTNLWRGLTDIINQNIANDFREFSNTL